MKKLLFILASSPFITTVFGDLFVDKNMGWSSGADNVIYEGDYSLTRTGWSRDLDDKFVDTNLYNGTLGIVGYRLGLKNVTIKGGGSLTISATDELDSDGNYKDREDAPGTPTIGYVSFSSATVDEATLNFNYNGSNFVTTGVKSILTLKNGSVANLTNFSGANNGTNSLVIKGIKPVKPDENTPAPARSTVNFLGNNSDFTNIYFESDSGTGLNINFKTTSDKVNINFTNAVGILDWRSYVTADSKDITINNSQTNNAEMSFSATTFKDFKTMTFEGSSTGLYVFNSTSFIGKDATSKIYVNKSFDFRGTTSISNAEMIIDKDVAVNFTCTWGNALTGGGTITVEGGGSQDTVTVNVDGSKVSNVANDSLVIGTNTTLVLNRTFEVIDVEAIKMENGAKFTLNKDSNVNKLITLTGNTATLGVGADIVMQGFDMGNKAELTIEFADGASLDLNELINIGSIVIDGDVYQRFKIFNVDETNGMPSDAYISKFSALSGNEVTFDRISEGTYWVNTTAAVPEPAELAIVFGALALGFAVYRKRR